MSNNISFADVTEIGFNLNRLPAGYTEVEYIKSVFPNGKWNGQTGDALYVELPVSGVNGCRIRGSINSTTQDHSLYGARNGWTTSRFGFTVASEGNGKFVFMHANGQYRFDADTEIHFIDDNCSKPGYCYIDSQTPIQVDTTNSVSSNKLWLFNDNCTAQGYSNATMYGGEATIYMAEFYKNQVLVSYPVPCIRDSDNTKGFYDIVNNVFVTATIAKGAAELQAGDVVNKTVVKLSIGDTVVWTKP